MVESGKVSYTPRIKPPKNLKLNYGTLTALFEITDKSFMSYFV